MDTFFTFIHQKDERPKFNPSPLYIEIYEPQYEPRKEKESEIENSDSHIIIIEL